MYWCDQPGLVPPPGTVNAIRRANLDGTGEEGLIELDALPAGIALDLVEGKVYWTERILSAELTGRIQRAKLDGSAVETVVTDLERPAGIVLQPGGGYEVIPAISARGLAATCLIVLAGGTIVILARRPVRK